MKNAAGFLAAAVLVGLAAPASANHHLEGDSVSAPMDAALEADVRSGDKARDQWRHPAQTLAFFGVEPGMTVVDYMPAGGYYTKILVPYLGKSGRYIGIAPDPAAADNESNAKYFSGLPGKFLEASAGWGLNGAPISAYASNEVPDALKGQVDRVLIFREMHNLLRSGALYTELTRARSLLKDGGMLGIVQHRAKPDASADYANGSKGYLREKDVVSLVEAHDFELVKASELNANPRDSADHARGVWELPPVLGSKDASKAAIGESDRMTLLFRKRM